MQITAIEKAKRSGYNIYIDGEYAVNVGAEILSRRAIRAGDELSAGELDDLRFEEEVRRARERALRLLQTRDHASGEVYDKLRRTYDERAAAQVVKRLLDAGLLDDRRFAHVCADSYRRSKGFVGARLRQELMRRHLDRAIIDEVMDAIQAEMDEEDGAAGLKALVERKYEKTLTDERGLGRAAASLGRLGYRWGDIREVLEPYREKINLEKEFLDD